MKNLFKTTAFAMSLAILSTGIALADDMAAKSNSAAPAMTPAASKPAAKPKMAKKKAAKEKYVWACPMGDYSGPRTKDGQCPNCHMDLVKQKVTESKPAAEKTDKKM